MIYKAEILMTANNLRSLIGHGLAIIKNSEFSCVITDYEGYTYSVEKVSPTGDFYIFSIDKWRDPASGLVLSLASIYLVLLRGETVYCKELDGDCHG